MAKKPAKVKRVEPVKAWAFLFSDGELTMQAWPTKYEAKRKMPFPPITGKVVPVTVVPPGYIVTPAPAKGRGGKARGK